MLNIFNAINGWVNLMVNDDETNTQKTNINLSDESMMDIFLCLKRFEFPKGHILVKPNEVCRYLYFIDKGAARIFYNKDGKDVTDGFRGDETLLLTMGSFIKQKPDKRGIELLVNTTLFAIEHNDLEKLCDKHHDIERLYRMVLSSAVIMDEQRVERMLFQSAQERYEDFIKTNKGVHKLLSLGMIASFLGITQETLSRIRAKY